MTTPRLNLVVLRVLDLERCRLFYEALGVDLTQEQHGSGPVHLASDFGDLVLELYPATEKSPPTIGAQLGFDVDALDKSIASAVDADGKVVSGPICGANPRRAILADPEGHRIHLSEVAD
ncbi:MAG: bleomycin resistance protein [Planctomycetaceae bacterium]|nr:bleomycin resistance protein [Planctomycetaceae bacterium]